MKMKEKKTEEVTENVIEVEDKILDSLELFRRFEHQYEVFKRLTCPFGENRIDAIYESLGIDVSEPVEVLDGFNHKNVVEEFDKLIKAWIDEYNKLDLNDLDNYTQQILSERIPNICQIRSLRSDLERNENNNTW